MEFEVPNAKTLHPGRRLGWHDYADAWLSGPLGRLLDYGCNRGTTIDRLSSRCDGAWGVDVDPGVLPADRKGARFAAVKPGDSLPFEDSFFDTVAILEVIEHVSDERATLKELARVLAPGGRLILTTPHKGLLTFMDPGNAKFVAPKFHRFIHTRILRNGDYYEQRFGSARRERGMVGDFTLDQDAWHRHYSFAEIRALTPAELETVAWRVYYPAMRTFWCADIAAKTLTRGRIREVPGIKMLQRWASHRETRLGDQLVVLFRKRARGNGEAPRPN